MKNKKSQIGSTLTWFIAFIIIFFIILLFITSSIIIAGQKETSINIIKYSSENLELNRILAKLLNTPVEFENGKISIKELIRKWDMSEDEERNKIKEALKQGIDNELPSYYFTIYRNSPDAFLPLENNPGEAITIGEYQSSLIYLTSDKGILKISLSFDKYEEVPI